MQEKRQQFQKMVKGRANSAYTQNITNASPPINVLVDKESAVLEKTVHNKVF